MITRTFRESIGPLALAVALAGCVGESPLHDEEVSVKEAGLTKGTPGAANGQVDFCDDPANPCIEGEGDCDSDADCEGTLRCGVNNGASFGFPSQIDVCIASPNGAADFCAINGPCAEGQGDCDSDAECAAGLVCGKDNGAAFGFSSVTDVCVSASVAQNGDFDFCSTASPCSSGEGDCDSDAECATGLVCGTDNGAGFGFSSATDVCIGLQNGDPNFCSTASPCAEGQGDCDGDAECQTGLVCGTDIGAEFGFGARTDVCVSPCSVDADCDDGVSCTGDACVDGLCRNAPNDARCDDGVFCNGAEFCDRSTGCSFGPPACDTTSCFLFCDESTDTCVYEESC